MAPDTRTRSYSWRLGLLVLILPGLVSGDTTATADATGRESGQGVVETTQTVSSLICPVESWKISQAELFELPVCLETRWGRGKALLDWDGNGDGGAAASTTVTASTTSSGSDNNPTGTGATDHELDTDSPLDNSNFLSFEDWKKQNLARVGQSAENVGRHRQGVAGGQENRRRPTGINNALDSLGEDAEIELDFAGFGAGAPESATPTAWGTKTSADGEAATGHVHQGTVGDAAAEGVSRRGTARRKDAGTTCKERFNYASFDCAATVLKTNPQCTGSSSVLIENKDSYMLNECRAKEKFLILELCDDILVDTIVLANYEFFSSIFRTFRVSVSDRYPAKEWKELGVYEARNTREIQAFAVENPLIWARYVKIEFLTHYGNEFYCPVSLVRIHGTTMLEEYKHEGDVGRGEEEVVDEAIEQAEEPAVVQPTGTDHGAAVVEPTPAANATNAVISHNATDPGMCPVEKTEEPVLGFLVAGTDVCTIDEAPLPSGKAEGVVQAPTSTNGTLTSTDATNSTVFMGEASEIAGDMQKRTDKPGPSPASFSSWSTQTDRSEQDIQTETDSRPTVTAAKEEQNVPPEPVKATVPQPPAANPTTQESFFKSVNKRLQMLESNSSLSLLYIEEQSRILRDAFNKVEKRQLAKTTTFLENLNTTVLNELKEFREQYDHVWTSVAVQFEHQRIQYHQEIQSMASQLGVLADEIVFQKRISVIQSIFVLICFGLVLFSRNVVGSYMEFPIVQNMVRSRSYSLRSSSPSFGSPSTSPTSTRPPSSYDRKGRHRRNISEDSQDSQSSQDSRNGPISPTIAYSPPTPSSDTGSPSDGDGKMRLTPESSRVPTPDPPTFRPGSSPPTLSGRPDDVEPEELQSPQQLLSPSHVRPPP
ncbi:Sad1/UNC domain protein [Paecilomyces variotii No. 5]|uniref:Sad1/UNC domain protein n=1 Tax=Byssochlamys spectabilis (strain No. 5 / NBRC 109023) TaxID=1356009 RepID=V5FTN0_BYSSN|nr:Sad1/UNC domain protein [Paecilomyces variotii No. 5]